MRLGQGKTTVSEGPTKGRRWSTEQQAIFDWFKKGKGHLVVRARAGTGKTTTMLEAVKQAPEGSILLTSFMRRITNELERRNTCSRAEVKSINSLGNKFLMGAWGYCRVNQYERPRELTRQVCADWYKEHRIEVPFEVQKCVTKLHTKGRELEPHATEPDDLDDLMFRFDCDLDPTIFGPDHPRWDNELVKELAIRAMEKAAEGPTDGTIDYADQIYIPLRLKLVRPIYDLVVCDEGQDMSAPQLELTQGACAGRFCLIGDDRQAIFAFRGADITSLDRLKGTLKAKELGLKTTYRCGQTIVQRAQGFVRDIVAAESNPDGEILQVPDSMMMDWINDATPGDYILSRLNAPLVSFAMFLLKKGIRARVAGKDIAAGLNSIIERLSQKSGNLGQFAIALETWRRAQVQYAYTQERPDKAEHVNDQAEMIHALVIVSESIPDLKDRIKVLFVDEDDDKSTYVLCSSVHKAKGLEADRVFLYMPTFRSGSSEEENIEYVAITRAKSTLVLVGEKTPPKKPWEE